MGNLHLWDELKRWKEEYNWIDLTHSLSAETPHWAGWPALEVKEVASLSSSLFNAHLYTTVGQYGTHVDAPSHMVKGGRNLDEVTLHEMVMPLCVIDMSSAVKEDVDYSLTKDDVIAWEERHGELPAGAFVAFRSDWSKREANSMDNVGEDGIRHFPGWSLGAVKYMVEQRNIAAIGHETSDTEAPILSQVSNYEVEYYILAQDRIQVELLANLDLCPAVGGVIFCTFPKVLKGTGFPARCFALYPKN